MVEYISERKNAKEYGVNIGGRMKQEGVIEFFKDYYKILGLKKGESFSSEDLTKAYRKISLESHPDRGGSQAKSLDTSFAYSMFSDDKKYTFELTKAKTETIYEKNGKTVKAYKTKDVFYKKITATPREFYDQQRALDLKATATKDMFNALANYKDLTLSGLQDFLRDGADIEAVDSNGKSAIYFAFENKNTEILTALIKDLDKNIVTVRDSKGNSLLIFAIQNKLGDLVEILLKKGIDVHVVNKDGKSAIDLAFQDKNLELLTMLVTSGAKVNVLDDKKDTLLTFASYNAYEGFVELLISKGADVNAVNAKGKNAIFYALESESIKIITALVSAGADVNIVDKNKNTLLMIAINKKASSLVTLWFDKGVNNIEAANIDGKTAIVLACKDDNAEVLLALVNALKPGSDINTLNFLLMHTALKDLAAQANILIKKGASLEAVNKAGQNAIQVAYKNGNFKTLTVLIKALAKGSDVEMPDANGNTLLMLAVQKDLAELVTTLLKQGASLKATNKQGETAFDMAHKGNYVESLTAIIKNANNLDLEVPDVNGNTLLMFAVARDQKKLIDALISKGANIEAVNKVGYTAFGFAYKKNYINIMKLLIQKKATPAVVNTEKNSIVIIKIENDEVKTTEYSIKVKAVASDTPLLLAYKDKNIPAMEALLKSGANANIADDNGNSVSMFAANSNDIKTLELLKGKIDLDLTNKMGKTALWFAYNKQHQDAMKWLIGEGAVSSLVDVNKNSIVVLKVEKGQVKSEEIHIEVKITDDNTPLILACKGSDIKVVEAIIKSGAKLDTADSYGNTALMFAVAGKRKAIIEMLIKHSVNLDLTNKVGLNALGFAQKKGEDSITELLLASGASTKNSVVSEIVKSFRGDPTKFVLDYHTKVGPAISAIEHLIDLATTVKLRTSFKETLKCLETKDISLTYDKTLDAMCGKNGLDIHHDEF